MDALVVGYGKIGRIKSFIWHSLGRRVYVYDTDAKKQKQAEADGFELHVGNHRYGQDLVVDISTPASFHLESLKWVFGEISPRPRTVLIEKPLASTQDETVALLRLVREEYPTMKQAIVVNESYYLSSALDYVANAIAQDNLTIWSIHAELSKNRIADVAAGRFIDPHLGALGIELPHMIAIVQRLGVDLSALDSKRATVFRKDVPHNEGFRLEMGHDKTEVVMESYLGDFRIDEVGPPISNDDIVRTVEVVTDKMIYRIEFDPVSGIERYNSKVHIIDAKNNTHDFVIVEDDHLARHLRKIHLNHTGDLDTYFGIENAAAISNLIINLKELADYKQIESK